MTAALDADQVRNFREAFAASDAYAQAEGIDLWALRDRVAFVMWSEGRGYNWANDGTNRSNSPGFDKHPEWPAILRRSLSMPHDRVGDNGRSTGCTQALSRDVGGSWLTMAETMNVALMVTEFCRRVTVTNKSQYAGTLLTPTGKRPVTVNLSSPIAADVLRIQQPLADEAESSNYNAAQVATALGIARDARFAPRKGWSDMATEQEVEAAAGRAFAKAIEAALPAIAGAVVDSLKFTSKVNNVELTFADGLGYINKGVDRLNETNIVHSRVKDGDNEYPNTPAQTLGQLTEWTNLEVHELNAKVDRIIEKLAAGK